MECGIGLSQARDLVGAAHEAAHQACEALRGGAPQGALIVSAGDPLQGAGSAAREVLGVIPVVGGGSAGLLTDSGVVSRGVAVVCFRSEEWVVQSACAGSTAVVPTAAADRVARLILSGRPNRRRYPRGLALAFGVTDSRFIMGSMGSVVGEKITRLVEHALQKRLPLVIVSGSGGGARMYEGVLSLMQMAKASAALARFHKQRLPYISVLTNPTMGGVMASFASLGDVILAEPRALLGFAGPRVIEQTIRQKLPPDFQTSEFLLEHGLIDRVVDRKDIGQTLKLLLDYFS